MLFFLIERASVLKRQTLFVVGFFVSSKNLKNTIKTQIPEIWGMLDVILW